MTSAYEKFRDKVVHLQNDVNLFETFFLDKYDFKKFADNLGSNVSDWLNICITGYFSETIRESLENIMRMRKSLTYKIRLIFPHLESKNRRDRMNLQALRKLAKAGAEIKVNERLHTRFLVAYNKVVEHPSVDYSGMLLIGSFDFNRDCIALERYDAGIKTMNPDMVKSAVELFEKIWNEDESIPIEDFGKNRKQ